ncbi:lymphocyte cytosolic protein 2a isoform X2 [Girardinichthys multiradiatus]|uniref:lymphocyte cytosolic protein 2a isoform X2 n=1 Tax=Girardinichthys multiradiatus TaxID=208333 RepID=UPI001FAC1BB3|nr:lymphocyte cytosolic protein 2a isoform X2 [Girardinichthys multiradiatus]
MSLVPYMSDVMVWNPQQLADYLKRMNLPGCDKVVLKNSINGSRFVNLTDNDLQKFPKLHAPMISKLSSEIHKNVKKRGLFVKKPPPKYNEPAEMNADGGWGEDEFDDEEFDDDYESPYSDDEDDRDYESPNEEQDPGNDYEPPPSEPAEDLTHKLCPSQPIGDGDYIDRRDNNMSTRDPPPALCPRPPNSTLSAPTGRMPGESLSRRDPSPHGAGRPPGNFPSGPPKVCRDSKPGRDSRNTSSPVRGPQYNSADRPGAQSWRPKQDASDPPRSKPPGLPPFSSSVNRSNSSARGAPPSRFDGHREQTQDVPKHNTFPLHKSLPPRPGIPGPVPQQASCLPPSIPSSASLPHKLQSAIAEHRGSMVGSSRPPAAAATGVLDPQWYVGKVTRGQAEGCLKQVDKDGAYLVRDSTRQQANQPFTLMVFYQDKVYNIQIRQQNQQFQLGTGLKAQEFFPSVSDIISHYSQSPLVLIDAKNRSSSQQNQCLLSDPAAYYMTGQNWS